MTHNTEYNQKENCAVSRSCLVRFAIVPALKSYKPIMPRITQSNTNGALFLSEAPRKSPNLSGRGVGHSSLQVGPADFPIVSGSDERTTSTQHSLQNTRLQRMQHMLSVNAGAAVVGEMLSRALVSSSSLSSSSSRAECPRNLAARSLIRLHA